MNVPRGSVYGIIGKNGAGKTTLMRLICGLQNPTAGTYSIFGADRKSPDIYTMRRRMGAVVDSPAIDFDMTARENIVHQCIVLGLPSFETADEILALVGLKDTGNKKAKDFSLGMKQRLGIGKALVGNPDFLVLDEPANGLDPEGIVGIRELILKLNREREITFLISSHILDELSKMATHYGFIDGGRLLKEISAKELEAICRKYTRLKVSDIAALCLTLEKMGIEYQVVSEDEADLFSLSNVTELVLELAKMNCEVLSVKEHDESLESYYINLVGGGANA